MVLTIRPNANGDTVQWMVTDSDHYTSVDEETPNGDTDYVKEVGANDIELFNLEDHTTESGAISNVKVKINAMRFTAVNKKIRIIIKTGGTIYDNGEDILLGASYAYYEHDWAENPNTGQAWTWSEIDSLQAGVKTAAANQGGKVTWLAVEVTYSAGATYTKEYSADTLLKKSDISKTYSSDVLIQKQGITKTYSADLLLLKTVPKTYPADVLLKKLGITKTYTADVILGVPSYTKEYTADVLLKKLDITKQYSSDVLLQKQGITKTYVADLLLLKSLTKTYSSDVLLKKADITKTYNADLLLKKSDLTKTYPADVLLLKSIPKTYSADILLKKLGITKTYTVDVIIGKVWTGIIKSDLSILERGMSFEEKEIGMKLEVLEREMKIEEAPE